MSIKIPIETSARHIHVSRKDFEFLFGRDSELHYTKELSQPGQYLCQERLSVLGPKGTFENIAILGPFRKETQVELSLTDTRKLGIPGCIRQSGDIEGTPGCILRGPCGELSIQKGVIVAKRHIHMTPADAEQLGLKDKDVVSVKTTGERSMVFNETVVRVSDKFLFRMHIDTDEANAAGIAGEVEGEIIR